MNEELFRIAFEEMRLANLGRQFERRELGLLASKRGIYFNSTMWAAGLGTLFNVAKLGPKYVYSFRNIATAPQEVHTLSVRMSAYRNNRQRMIDHAKAILRRYDIHNID